MQFNLKQALTYIFPDKKLLQKILVMYVLLVLFFLSFAVFSINSDSSGITNYLEMLVSLVMVIILNIPVCGYYAVNINKRIIRPESKLPELDEYRNIVKAGLFMFGGVFVWNNIISMAFFLIMFLPLFAVFLVAMSTNKYLIILWAVILILLTFFIGALMLGVCAAFCTDLRFQSFFDFEKLKLIFVKNFESLIKLTFITALFFTVCVLISIVMAVTVVGILLVPLVILYYWAVLCDLNTQFLRHIFQIETTERADG